MKIGIEAQRIFRPKKHGMDVVAIELIKNLQEVDQKNEYTVFGRTGVNDIIPEKNNFRVDTFSAFTYADWEQVKLPARVKKSRADLVHCTANTAPLNISAPMVVTIHDIIYLEQVDFKGTAYQNLGNLYRRFIVPKIAKKAKLVLTVSEFEKQNLVKRLHIPEEKVKVLYNAVGAQFHNHYPTEEAQAFREKYKLPSEFIMFLGNTAPKKNTANVIKAYVDLCITTGNRVPMVLLDYKKEAVAGLLKTLNQSALLQQFIFPGYVPYRDIALLYNSAALFLYPSLRESFGLPILEAMACGVPVITSNTSSMPEVAGDAAILIDPFNYKDLSSAMARVLGDDSLRNELHEKGLKRVQHFAWGRSARELLNVYETAAAL